MVYNLFEKGGHRVTIRNRSTNVAMTRRFFNQKQLDKIISNQNQDEDIYIEKYGKSNLVQVIILDLDSEDDTSLALSEAKRCKNYFERNGNNCIIVSSGKKGFHLYVQIAPAMFKSEKVDENKWFKCFVARLLSGLQKPLTTLDEVNSSAGLNGNIRVIGSKHPSTGNECQIIDGKVKSLQPPTDLTYNALQHSYNDCVNFEETSRKKKEMRKQQVKFGETFDPIADIDLRDVFRQLADDYKDYGAGYGYCRCLWHGDNNPSLLVTQNFYSCASCGAKGNIYQLKKEGLVDWDYEGTWSVK